VPAHDQYDADGQAVRQEPLIPTQGDGWRSPFVSSGLTLAGCVLLWKPLVALAGYLDLAGGAAGLQVLPAVTVTATVFGAHQFQRRRQHLRAARQAAQSSRDAKTQVDDMARLVAFSQALLRSRDEASIRAVTEAHMPSLIHKRPPTRMPGPDAQKVEAGLAVDTPERTERERFVLDNAKELMAAALQASESFREVYENSRQDALTGCFNRTHAIETLEGELRRARRSRTPFSLLMFDLDQFKDINDRFGHLCGDAVLGAVGTRMKAATRSSDIKSRYGGDEFLIILPDTPLTGARQVCETLRRAIAKDPIAWSSGEVHVTASFGVTEITPGEIDPLAIIARADSGLYEAKRQGRNCVWVVDSTPAAKPEQPAAHPAAGPLKAAS
jgi:diguanylate cyclase (GGDEF)-like protein